MLKGKTSTKRLAIIVAVCLLLATAVTTVALTLGSRKSNVVAIGDSVGQATNYKFTINQPTGMTLLYSDGSALSSFDDIISSGTDGLTFFEGTGLAYLEKTSEDASSGTKYTVAVSESKKQGNIDIYYTGANKNDITVTKPSNGSFAVAPFSATLGNLIRIKCNDGSWPSDPLPDFQISLQRLYKVTLQGYSSFTFSQVSSASETGEGTAISGGSVEVKDGSPFYFKIKTIKEGEAIASVSVYGNVLEPSEQGVYTIESVDSDTQIIATRGYKVTEAEGNPHTGYTTSITVNTVAAMNVGFTFRVTPQNGYEVTVSAKMGGTDLGENLHKEGNSYTIDKVTGAVEVTITVTAKKYEVVHSSLGQSVFSGSDLATYNSDYTFTLTPNAGYTVSNVYFRIGTGNRQEATSNGANSWKITGNLITDTVTITAETKAQEYQVTIKVNDENYSAENGKVEVTSASGSTVGTTATIENNFRFTVKEKEGYSVTGVSVSIKVGESSESCTPSYGESSYQAGRTITIAAADIRGNITITISVQERTSRITLTSGNYTYQLTSQEGGEITYRDGVYAIYDLPYNKTVTFSLSATEGYDLRDVKVTLDGVDIPVKAQEGQDQNSFYETNADGDETGRTIRNYTIKNVVKDAILSVSGVKKQYTVKNSSGMNENYTLTVNGTDISSKDGSVVVLEGDRVTMTLVHTEGFGFKTVTLGQTSLLDSVTSGVEYEITGEANQSYIIRVVVAENTYTVRLHDSVSYPDDGGVGTVELKYTTWGDDPYNFPTETDTYYDRVWHVGSTSGSDVSPLNKSDIKDQSKEIEVYAVWSWTGDDSLRNLLDVISVKGQEDKKKLTIGFDISENQDWKKLDVELQKHGDRVEALGFVFTANSKFLNEGGEGARQKNYGFSETIKACLATTGEGWKQPGFANSAMTWWVDESAGPASHQMPTFSALYAWQWQEATTNYHWTFTSNSQKGISYGSRMTKGWVSVIISGDRKVIEQQNLKVLTDFSGMEQYKTKTAAATLPEAPSVSDEGSDQPTIE